jgi:hypothetical protein
LARIASRITNNDVPAARIVTIAAIAACCSGIGDNVLSSLTAKPNGGSAALFP